MAPLSTHFSFLNALLAGLTLLGLLLMLWHSAIRRNADFSMPLLLALLGINAGVFFFLLHWKGGSQLLIGGSLLLIATYSVWFWRKAHKARLDYLKLLWITGLGLSLLLVGAGWRRPLPYVSGVANLAFWAMLLDFLFVTYLRRNSAHQS